MALYAMHSRFIRHSMPLPRIADDWEEPCTIYPVVMYRLIFTAVVIQDEAFRILGAEEEPAAPVLALRERDEGMNHPFNPQIGEHWAHAYPPVTGLWGLELEIFQRQAFAMFLWTVRASLSTQEGGHI